MQQKQLLTDIVYLRCFAIIAVVLYHAYCPYMGWEICSTSIITPCYNFIFNILLVARMPLFVFISGYLFSYLYNYKQKYQNGKAFVIDKAKRLLILYVICRLIDYFIMPNLFTHVWFLIMLFYCFMFTRFVVANTKNHYIWAALGILLAFLSINNIPCLVRLESDSSFVANLFLSSFIKYYIWFYLGYVVAYTIYNPKYKIRTNYFKWAAAISFALYIVSVVWCYFCKNNFVNKSILQLFCIVSVFCFMHYLFITGKLKPHTFADKINSSSYGIYILHHYFLAVPVLSPIIALQILRPLCIAHPIIYPLTSFVLCFGLCYVLTFFILKTKIGRFLIG